MPRFTPIRLAPERHRHCGAGPRLTADGRYPLPCAEELGLSSRRCGLASDGRAAIRSPRWPGDSTSRGPPTSRPNRTGVRSPDPREAGFAPCAHRGGRRITCDGPPARTRSIASFASASATEFWARGTCVADQTRNPPRIAFASDHSGWSLASFTRHRPWSCSTMSIESRKRSTRSAPSSRARPRARTTPVHSATLFVVRPRYSEIDASGRARGSSASGREPSISATPSDAGPGFPRAAPSVRTTYRRPASPASSSPPQRRRFRTAARRRADCASCSAR